jgi:hydrogenase maturation factor HypF (carbamoyltransferase family)
MISSIVCAVGVIVAIEGLGGLDLATRVDSARGQLTNEEKMNNSSKPTNKSSEMEIALISYFKIAVFIVVAIIQGAYLRFKSFISI